MKGFAEPLEKDEQNASPTANRVSHRVVCQTSTQKRWPLVSLDIAVAFLKGLTFKQLESKGIPRRPVAFCPCADVWQILSELNPAMFSEAAKSPNEYVFVLEKTAYGLRDAPLLWRLRAMEVMKELSYTPLLHDSCTLVLREPSSQRLKAILTVHVDDFLMTAEPECILQLEQSLIRTFGPMTLDRAVQGFRHFGVDIKQNGTFDKVTASQQSYLDDLRAIEMPLRCNKQSPVPAEKVTEYRALVSAIAWLGVTSPPALASASLLQGCLPNPTWGDVSKLNNCLEGLRTIYCPLIYQYIAPPWRLLSVSDSSFGNMGKYSQGGFVILLCSATKDALCNIFCLIDFKSNKSKRVATSTLHAEALACIASVENATFVQTYYLELHNPSVTALQLLHPEKFAELIPIVTVSDCTDLHASLIAPAVTSSPNKHLGLYVAALREFRSIGRIEANVWIDTRDMIH